MNFERKISLKRSTAALVVAAAALTGVAGAGAVASLGAPEQTVQLPATAAVSRAGAHSSLADMVETVSPSVVQVDATGEARAVRTPFGYLRQPGRTAVGSGFIVARSGLVITNNHVVDSASKVAVTLSDGTKRTAKVLGRDVKTDIAVLQIEGGGDFQPVEWGNSDSIRVGESVFAVGSPFGLGNTVTSGIVSARGREIGAGPYDDFLQVDAAINTGNSGGPLFDATGRVVGVNTAIVSPSGGNVGIGFAIPARLAQKIAGQIVDAGEVTRGYVGVGLQEINPSIANALGLKESTGALIAQVENASPAAVSGLRSGDVVRRFAGKTVRDSRDFARMVADASPGATVSVTVLRAGREGVVKLKIGEDQPSS